MKSVFDRFALCFVLSVAALALFIFLAFDIIAIALAGTPPFFLMK